MAIAYEKSAPRELESEKGKVVTTFADSTDRELRLGNNVEKLYRADEFL